jgi:hypothetical protein
MKDRRAKAVITNAKGVQPNQQESRLDPETIGLNSREKAGKSRFFRHVHLKQIGNSDLDNFASDGCLSPGTVPEIRNKHELPKSEIQNVFRPGASVLVLGISDFEFVSSFGIRASDFEIFRVG